MMNKLIGWLPPALLVITLSVLGMHIFSAGALPAAVSPGQPANINAAYRRVADIPLGKVEVFNYRRMGFTHGFVRFSPDGRYLAVGTENGDIVMMGTDGRQLWRKQLGLGKISALHFARDSRSLLIGETSQQGSLLSWDAETGTESWRQSSVEQLGVDLKQKTFPGIVSITADQAGNIYAAGQRYIKYADGRSQYQGRIYRLSPAGDITAMFPADGNLDSWVSWLSVDDAGDKLVFGTANWDAGSSVRFTATIYCLDGRLRSVLWSKNIEPVPPYQNTTMRSSPDISADGRYVAGVSSDGRGYLFGGDGRNIWQRSISRPRTIAGVSINAVGSNVQYTGFGVILTTGNTYNRANWQLPTPVEHPGSNSMFVFDRQGMLLSRYNTGGMIEQFSVGGDQAVLAVGRNTKTRDTGIHGLYVLSLPDLALISFFSMNGPCVGVAISSDQRYIAGVEAPLQLDDGSVTGTYRLLLFERRN